MTIVVVKTVTEEKFFERGRELARLADAAEPLATSTGWPVRAW